MYRVGSYEYIALRDYNNMKDMEKLYNYKLTCLCAEQCIEKFLKAYIMIQFVEDDITSILRAHKLTRLVDKAGVEELLLIKGDLRYLSNLYVDSQYPGDEYTDCTGYDASLAISCANKVYAWFTGLYPLSRTSIRGNEEYRRVCIT